jgi:actin-related protein
VLYDGIRRSPVAGNHLSERFTQLLEEKNGVPVVPSYRIKSKTPVGEAEAARFEERKVLNITDSFDRFAKQEVVLDFQSAVGRVASPSYREDYLTALPTTPFEFPNGYHNSFGMERYTVPELLFDPQKWEREMGKPSASKHAEMTPTEGAAATEGGMEVDGSGEAMSAGARQTKGIHMLVKESVDTCDIDIHNNMWSNIVMTGGATLYDGFHERLNAELQRAAPVGSKVKILQQLSGSHRLFSPWVGGSILASLGSFQQMWVSKQEYDESGTGIIEKKCP